MEEKIFSTQFAKRDLTVTICKTSCLANGSCWVRYGETTVMVNVTMAKNQRDDIDFFPLSVEFEEKQYAAGKIPGSFMKREGKPSESSILISRCIDRSIRPFFPKDMRNEVSIVATVLSTDVDNNPEICAMLGVAISLSISDIPWNGPIVGVNVGLVKEKIIVNPNKKEREISDLDLTVSGSYKKIAMIEAGANEIEENKMLECIKIAHEEIKKMITFVEKIKKECGKEKFQYTPFLIPEEISMSIKKDCENEIEIALEKMDKQERDETIEQIVKKMHEKYKDQIEDLPSNTIETIIYNIEKKIVRRWLLEEGKRVDKREMNEIRPLSCEIDFLPIVHGCGIFTRTTTK